MSTTPPTQPFKAPDPETITDTSASAIALSREACWIGFAMYASIPAARHRASSPAIAWAVIATIGVIEPSKIVRRIEVLL